MSDAYPGPPPPLPPRPPLPGHAAPAAPVGQAAPTSPVAPTAPGGWAAPYATPARPGLPVPPAPAAASRVIGIVALALALVTLIVPTAIALGTMPLIGGAAAPAFWYDPPIWSWDHLTPVKGEVLATEIAFWAGTVVGCVSIALGVVAIARRRGRGFGIAAVVVGVLAFFVFMVAGFFAFTFGMTFAY